ncbi:MAG: TRAP transporter substrate-binding protein DctP [Magnetococcus sp. WYHC-3]
MVARATTHAGFSHTLSASGIPPDARRRHPLLLPWLAGLWAGLLMLFVPLAMAPEAWAADATWTLDINAVHNRSLSYVRALERIAARVGRDSGGRLKVAVHASTGSEGESLKDLIRGRLGGAFLTPTALSFSFRNFRALEAPGLFQDYQQVREFVGSPMDDRLRAMARSRNLHILGYGSAGFPGILVIPEWHTLGEEGVLSLRTPADPWVNSLLEGYTLSLEDGAWRGALRLKTASVPVEDVEGALSAGWIHGVWAAPEILARTSWAGRAARYLHPRLIHGWVVLAVGARWFGALPTDLRNLLERTAREEMERSLLDAEAVELDVLRKWQAGEGPRVELSDPRTLAAPLRARVEPELRQIQGLWGGLPGLLTLFAERTAPGVGLPAAP